MTWALAISVALNVGLLFSLCGAYFEHRDNGYELRELQDKIVRLTALRDAAAAARDASGES